MTQHQKLEQKLNKMLERLKTTDLQAEEIKLINTHGFIYSVNRFNEMQILATLLFIAFHKNIELSEVQEILK